MRNLLITRGIITGKKVNALPKKRPIKKGESAEVAEVKEKKDETLKTEEKKDESPKTEEKVETLKTENPA
jgi:hypothetical protein